jgi:glutaredoxin
MRLLLGVLSSAALTASVAVALLAAPIAGAQPYRSVGPGGHVSYSDMPSTAAGARIGNDSSSQDGGRSASAGLPYVLAQVAQKYPVTLYSSPGCAPCDAGRNLLTRRGIPFAEKTVTSNDDITALKKIAGSANLPLLTIGGQQISGFQDSNWSQYLNAAGYPETSALPGSYQRSPATPLAPPPPPATAAVPSATSEDMPAAQSESPPVAPPPDPNNPAGIRF